MGAGKERTGRAGGLTRRAFLQGSAGWAGASLAGVLGGLAIAPRARAQEVAYAPFVHELGAIARNARLELNGRTVGLVRVTDAELGPRLDLVPPSVVAPSGVAPLAEPYTMEFSWGMDPDFLLWLANSLLPDWNSVSTLAIVRRLVPGSAGAPALDYRIRLEGARLQSFSWRSTTRESGFAADVLQHGRNEFAMSIAAGRVSAALEPALDPSRWGRYAVNLPTFPPQRTLLWVPGFEQHVLPGHSLQAQRMPMAMDPRSSSPWAIRFEALLPTLTNRLFPWLELFRATWTGGPPALQGSLRFYAESSSESQASLDLREVSPLRVAPAGAGRQVASFMCRNLTPRLAGLKPL